MAEIDSLEIEIKQSGKSANSITKNLDKLSTSLGNLEKAFSGLRLNEITQGFANLKNSTSGLGRISTAISKIGDSVKGIDEGNITKLERLATVLERFRGIGGGTIRLPRVNASGVLPDIQPTTQTPAPDLSGTTVTAGGTGATEIERIASAARNAGDETAKLREQIEGTSQSTGGLKRVNTAIEVLSERTTIASKASEALQKAFSGIKVIASGIGSGVKKLAGAFSNLSAHSHSTNTALGRLLNTFKRLIITRSLRAIIRSITDAFKVGVNNIYQYSAAMGTSLAPALDAVKTSFTTFKNSVGAAVAPLIEAFVPAIQTVCNWLIYLNNTIAEVFAFITGKSTFSAAVPAAQKFGEAVGGVGSSAGKTAKQLKELEKYIAPFDELNVMPKQDTGGSGGGGGGGSGGGSGGGYSNMFEERSVRNLLGDGDLGTLLAEKLNGINAAIDEWINSTFRPKIAGWAQKLADGFNSFIYAFDWELAGKTIGDGLDAILNAVNVFVTRFDAGALGAGLGKMIQAGFDAINWKQLADTISTGLIKVFDFGTNLFGNINFNKIGENIAKALQAIEWRKVGEAIGRFINTVIGGIADMIISFLTSTEFDGLYEWLNSAVDGFVDAVHWDELSKKLGNILITVVWRAIRAMFKNLSSLEFGGMLDSGNIEKEIDKKSKELGIQFDETLGYTILSESSRVENGTNAMIKDGITQPMKNLDTKSYGIEHISAYQSGLQSKTPQIKETASSISRLAATNLGSADTNAVAKTKIDEFIGGINAKKPDVKTSGTGVGNAFIDGTKVPNFKSNGEKATTDWASGITSKKSSAESAGKSIASGAVSGLSGAASKAISLGKDFALGYAKGISDNIKKAISSGTNLGLEAAKAVQKAQKSNSPSKVTRALGVDFGDGYILGIEGKESEAAKATKGLVNAALNVMSEEGHYGIDFAETLSKGFVDSFDTNRLKSTFSEIGAEIPRAAEQGLMQAALAYNNAILSDYTASATMDKHVEWEGAVRNELAKQGAPTASGADPQMMEQNRLLKLMDDKLSALIEKDTTVRISTADVRSGFDRANRRFGKTVN